MRSIASLLVVLTAAASTAVAILPTSSLAEAWPQRNVRIITPFPAGTGADISARLFAERLALRWEKPVIVENKPGADGILAVTAVVAHAMDTRCFTLTAVRLPPIRSPMTSSHTMQLAI